MMQFMFCIVGLDAVGSNLAKELAHFTSKLDYGDRSKIMLFDPDPVTEEDLLTGPFLKEDLGFNKAGVLASVLKENFNVDVLGFSVVFPGENISHFFHEIGLYSYNQEQRHVVVFDCSGEKRDLSSYKGCMQALPNVQLFLPDKKKVHNVVRVLGKNRSGRFPVLGAPLDESQKGLVKRLLFGFAVELIQGKQILMDDIILTPDGYGALATGGKPTKVGKEKPIGLINVGDPMLIICVGAGGTGGNLAKEVVHLLQNHKEISFLLIDGDSVEEKNTERQPFFKEDCMQNKAEVLIHALLRDHPELDGQLFACGRYLDASTDLAGAIASTGKQESFPVLVGAVDNHRARQVMQEFYGAIDSILYIDAANEWSNGEAVLSIKKEGQEQSPLRSEYFPEVLTDKSPSASELSCGAVNVSSPQHLATNLASAQTVLTALSKVVNTGELSGGIIFFDSFKCFGRFQPVSGARLQA